MRARLRLALAGLMLAGPAVADSFQSVPLGAYTSYTPTAAAPGASGTTFGTSSGRWQQTGKFVCIYASTSVSAAGTGGSNVTLGLPTPASSQGNYYINGVREGVGGETLKVAIGATASVASITLYNNATAIATGAVFYISGCYEAQ